MIIKDQCRTGDVKREKQKTQTWMREREKGRKRKKGRKRMTEREQKKDKDGGRESWKVLLRRPI